MGVVQRTTKSLVIVFMKESDGEGKLKKSL